MLKNEERIDPHKVPYWVLYEHLRRYEFAKEHSKKMNVLDIACGNGYGSSEIAKCAKYVVGVDVSSEAVDYSKSIYKNIANLTFVCADGVKLPFKDDFFDVVVSFETIEHIKDYKAFLRETYRVLKKEGRLIISTPNKEIYSFLLKNANQHHIKEFSLNEIINVLSQYYSDLEVFGQENVSKKEFVLLKGRFLYGNLLSYLGLILNRNRFFKILKYLLKKSIFKKPYNVRGIEFTNISIDKVQKRFEIVKCADSIRDDFYALTIISICQK